jgi:hypothetical protein
MGLGALTNCSCAGGRNFSGGAVIVMIVVVAMVVCWRQQFVVTGGV